jgi:O-antigen ligase
MSHAEAWPSNPFPKVTAADFALNLGLVIVGLNLLLTRPSRPWLRALVAGIALNTAALAVVGTFFKLSRATAILGMTPSPNPNFFSTFVYHNHWGAIALLGAAAAAGMALYHERRRVEAFHLSPAPFWMLCAALVLLAIPLSSGRASTMAAVVLTGGIGLNLLAGAGPNRGKWAAGLAVAALMGIIVVGFLGRSTLRNEFRETTKAIEKIQAGAVGEGRLVIYGDTLRLIDERPWFGWGWGSFQYVFPRFASPRPYRQTYQYEQYALDAHSDWLQFPAEVGVVGTGLLLAALVGWLRWPGRRGWSHSPSRELLTGCGALGLLAAVDFPTASPAIVATTAILLAAGAELARIYEPERASP